MVDRYFADPGLAALYDPLCGPFEGRADFGFYLPLVMAAGSVLDVGCGTGMLLHHARESGHTGRLCGLDPGAGMLEQARRRQGVEWVHGDLATVPWDREFDLVVMTGHAFQVFVGDEELRVALAAVHAALTDGGRFAFETRNPAAREWERWVPGTPVHVTDARVTSDHVPGTSIEGDLVRFGMTFTAPHLDGPRVSRSTLRFLSPDALASFLDEAGLAIEEQYGDWDRSPLTATSPEIITIAAKA